MDKICAPNTILGKYINLDRKNVLSHEFSKFLFFKGKPNFIYMIKK